MKTLKWQQRYERIAWKPGKTKADELAKLDLLQAAVAEFFGLEEKNLLSLDEAQALANANRVLKILTVSSADHLSEIGNSEIKALCDALDNRANKLTRRKGSAAGNKAKIEQAAARKRICVSFYKKKCSGKKNPPTKSQVFRDLRNQWLTLRGKTDLKPPAKSTFMGYVADL